MNRLEKKCFAASTGSHALLLCIIVFGSAFFISTKKEKSPSDYSKLKVVPSKLVDAAFSGGGGDPSVKPSEELQKGAPDAPPPEPEPPKPEPPKPEPPKLKPEPVAPPPDPIPAAPPEPTRATTKKSPLPLTETKRSPKPETKSDILAELKPTKRNDADKRKAQEKAAAEARAQAEREWNSQNQKLAKKIDGAVHGLSQGFEKGTVVKASGPGGEAYQNYADYVHQIYDDAWLTPDLMTDQEVQVEVRIIIHRSGRIIEARISKKSGSAALDRSVQSALDRVRSLKAFPESALDQQRTFIINFVPKLKKSIG